MRPAPPRARGNPEEAKQAHHVIDSQSGGVAQRGAKGLDERLVARPAQLPGHEGWQLPVLALRIEGIRRGPNRALRGEQVLPEPGVRAARIEADRQVRHDGQDFGRAGQLPIQEPLQPLVIAHRRPACSWAKPCRRAAGS